VVVSSRSVNSYPTRINKKILKKASDDLCSKDKDLKLIIEQYGYPPLWFRPENFSTLVQIILKQQVSLSSAKATFNKLKTEVFPITPKNILKFSLSDLNNIGFTRQKASYCLGLAENIVNDVFNLKNIAKLDSNAASEELIKNRGIGPWSADIYLLMALRHPDIWPKGDLALDTAIFQVKGLRKKPSAERLESITSSWRPWRSVAARILWHFYLSK
jgi:DNA-3-methyladenine glycosylase II